MQKLSDGADRCFGKIEFGESEMKRQVAAGSIIKANQKVLVATAAHCIYDPYNKEFYINEMFSLMTENFEKKYRLKTAFLHKKWVDEGALNFDTAFALLEYDSGMDAHYEDAVEPMFNLPRELDYTIFGFPPVSETSEVKPLFCYGKAHQHDKYPKIIQGILCDNKNGMSGGPWLTTYENGDVVQNSVSSFSFKADDNILWGPFWGKAIESVLHIAYLKNTWISAKPLL